MNQGTDIFSLFKIKLKPNQLYLLLILFSLPFFMYLLGERKAKATNQFWAIYNNDTLTEVPVIIKMYDNTLFCRKVDSSFYFKSSLEIIDSKKENLNTVKFNLDLLMPQ